MMLAMLGGDGESSRRWQERLAAAAAFVMSPKMLVRLSLVVMVIALVLTRSHMGNGAFVISMLLVGLALWLAMGLATGLRALPLLKDGQGSLNRGIGVASLMALSCLGLRSLVDFNLPIPATALTFAVLLSLVWVAPALPAASRKGQMLFRRRKASFPEDDDR
jgi:hypothetical protein